MKLKYVDRSKVHHKLSKYETALAVAIFMMSMLLLWIFGSVVLLVAQALINKG